MKYTVELEKDQLEFLVSFFGSIPPQDIKLTIDSSWMADDKIESMKHLFTNNYTELYKTFNRAYNLLIIQNSMNAHIRGNETIYG